jgi:hypothetical protein
MNMRDYIRELPISNFGQNAIKPDRVPIASGPLQELLKNKSVGSTLLPLNPFPKYTPPTMLPVLNSVK